MTHIPVKLEDGRELLVPAPAHAALSMALNKYFGPPTEDPIRTICSRLAEAGWGFSPIDTD